MATETERKFLVKGPYKHLAESSSHIIQAYLCSSGGRTARVRVRDDKGYITIKGPTNGVSRFEWEKEITADEAEELLSLCSTFIDKTRWLVPYEGHVFEVDEFHGANEGLTVAEVELSSPDEAFSRPDFLGEEVSFDRRYYNSQLLAHPFKSW